MFYRFATSIAISFVSNEVADILLPIQLGVGVEGGVETAVHYINATLTDPSTEAAGI